MEDKIGYQFQGDRIVVLPIEPGKTVEMNVQLKNGESAPVSLQATTGGILVPEDVAQQELSNSYVKGKVVQIGPDVTKYKIGQTVLVYVGRMDGDLVVNRVKYFIFREQMIAAIATPEVTVGPKSSLLN